MFTLSLRRLIATGLALCLGAAFAQAQWVESIRNGDVAYFLFAYSPRLERFSLTNAQWLAPIPLPTTYGLPSAFTVDAGNIFVAYGQSLKQYDLDGSKEIHLLNPTDPIQGIFTDGNLILVNHTSSLYARFTSLNRTNGAIIAEFENYVDSVVGACIARSRNKILGRSIGISPADITYVTYRDDGTFVTGGDSPYHGDFPDATRTWIFPKEDKVVDTSGTVYSTDDLTYLKSFGGTIDDLDFYGGEIPIVLRGNQLIAYSTTLLPTGDYTLPASPANIYLAGTNVLTFTADRTQTNGIRWDAVPVAKLNPPVPGEPVDPNGLVYTPDNCFLDTNGVVYLFSQAEQSLFRWDSSSQQYLPTIPLLDVPGYVAYSAMLHRVYLAYSSGLIRQIDLATTNFTESPFATLASVPRGLAVADKYVFAMDSSGAWGTHYTFDAAGNEVDSRDWNYYSSEFIWSTVNQKMYFFRDGTSPNDLLWEEINANGIAYTNQPGGIGPSMDSPLHDSSGFIHPIRVAPDGSIVVLGSGMIHDASTLARLPLSLGNAISDAAWLGSDLKTIRAVGNLSQCQTWTAPNFGLGTVRQFPGVPHRLFALSTDRLLGISILDGRPSFYVLDGQFKVIAPALLRAPTGLGASIASGNEVDLSWLDSSGEEAYAIERKTDADVAWTPLGATTTSATAFADMTVVTGGTYYYRVLASNGSLTSAPSAVVSVKLTPPDAPTNVLATALSSNAILLSWADVQLETGYLIERQDNPGGTWIQLASVPANTTAWTNSNLGPNTQYTYRLRATNGLGISPASAVSSVTTAPVPPTAPWFGTATATGPYTIALDWYGSYYQDNYVVERRAATNAAWVFVAMTPRDVTYYEDVGLTPLSSYQYRVYATNLAGASAYAYSPTVLTPQIPPPPVPSGLVALPVSPSAARLTWNDVAGESGYQLERSSETAGWAQVAVLPAGSTAFTDTNLLAGTQYAYRVRAFNDYGASGYSGSTFVSPVTVVSLLNDSFDPTPDPTVWASITGAVSTNGGPGYLGSPALWFYASGARQATTVPVNLSQGGVLAFQFRTFNSTTNADGWWNSSEPEEAVVLEYSLDGTQWFQIQILQAADWNSFSVPVPAVAWGPHTQFRWRQPSNSGPNLDCWALENFNLQGWFPALSAPAALVAVLADSNSISLRWIGLDNAESYLLERQQNNGPWLPLATIRAPVSSFMDTAATPDAVYSYRVKATNAGGESPYSPVAVCSAWTTKQAWLYANYGSPNALSSAEWFMAGPDGITPLWRYAFNLSSDEPGHLLQPGVSTNGMPAIWLDPLRKRLCAELVRRKSTTNPGIVYEVQFSSSPSSWNGAGEALNVTELDANWERVRYEDPVGLVQDTARFCRVVIRVE